MLRGQDQIFDELLVVFAQGGDAEALEELVRRWSPRLARHAALMSSRAAAPDVVQESLLAIARGIRRLDDPARFGAWAQRIVSNKCADWVRRERRERATKDGREVESVGQQPAAGNDDALAVRTALRALPPERRALLALRYSDGLTDGAISEALGIPIGTVKSRLHAAREELRLALEQKEIRDGES